jgi:hypothetical protein
MGPHFGQTKFEKGWALGDEVFDFPMAHCAGCSNRGGKNSNAMMSRSQNQDAAKAPAKTLD